MSFLDRALRLGEGKKFKTYEQRVGRINGYEPELEHYTDGELRESADELRERARGGESLDELMFECFALVREAGRRTMGMRHFDVQLIGGMVLHDGAIAEMRTGEGKTLTATLAVVLNSLAGRGVHLVTVNDYLARRGAHAADHLRRPRAGREPLREVREVVAATGPREAPGGDGPADEEGVHRGVRLRVRREAQDRLGDRAGRRQGRAVPRNRPPVPGRERPPREPPDPGAQGRVALQARLRL